MEKQLAEALERDAMGVITGLDTPDDCVRAAHVLVRPKDEALYVGNDKLKPIVESARGCVLFLQRVAPTSSRGPRERSRRFFFGESRE